MIIQNLTYYHHNKELLFDNISFAVNSGDKVAIVGNNGIGKSTLLNILAGIIEASSGNIISDVVPYYIPQLFGQYNNYTIAQSLNIENKLNAIYQILNGEVNDDNLAILNDDWDIEERCNKAMQHWQLNKLDLTLSMNTLSGGQKAKVFLAGLLIHKPELVLMDEPSNHLDAQGRRMLYDYVTSTSSTLVIVSHDRTLLNLINTTYEITPHKIISYGGNYDFYAEQKGLANGILLNDIRTKEKELRKAKEIERETTEKRQRLDARGKNKSTKEGFGKGMLDKMKNDAENSSARLKGVHSGKISYITQELSKLRGELPDIDKMRFNFDNSNLYNGKTLIDAKNINFSYNGTMFIWDNSLTFNIASGDRIAIKGNNGSGKTTLLNLILGNLTITSGEINISDFNAIYIDQEYSLIDQQLTIYQQSQKFNTTNLEEHEVKIRLFRFLFDKDTWDKPCSALSGGEKMRLMLCLLNIRSQSPDIIILDEPTNNLDIQNIEILTATINDYHGTLIAISHDEVFLNEIGITLSINLGD